MRRKEVIYEHTEAKSTLHRVNAWFLPFRWGINPYRGCEHDCVYCNARYTHEYLGLPTGDFAHKILVKDNAAAVLDRELSNKRWDRKWTVNMSTVTDPYQPVERELEIARDILEVFLKRRNALMVSTKSDLVLRDLDLLAEIARGGFLNVVVTIPSMDEELREKMEPRAPSIQKRIAVVRKIHDAGITVGVASVPLFPYISDSENDLERLIKTLAGSGADYVVVDVLNLRGEARSRVLPFIEGQYPELLPKYEGLYKADYCEKGHAAQVRERANRLIKEYHVDNYDRMFSYRKKTSA
ncbi:MAG: radical SAM protein [Euryarchaeota archaeon]|nr:radical SAM protein [Euryarchaeota archaeon]